MDKIWVENTVYTHPYQHINLHGWCQDILFCCLEFHHDCCKQYTFRLHGKEVSNRQNQKNESLNSEISQIHLSKPLVLQEDQWLFNKTPTEWYDESTTAKRAWLTLVRNAATRCRRYRAKQPSICWYLKPLKP